MKTKAEAPAANGKPKAWSQSFGQGDRKLSLFEYVNPKGIATLYCTVKDDRLPCGWRTRSLRHGDRAMATKWAEEILASGISLNDIPDIAKPTKMKPERKKGKKSKSKKEAKGKSKAKKPVKKPKSGVK